MVAAGEMELYDGYLVYEKHPWKEEDGKVLSAQVLLEAREVVAREETAARAKLKDAVAYLMERVDTQV